MQKIQPAQTARTGNVQAQPNQQLGFYVEFLGNAFLYSANLDYRFQSWGSARIGFGNVGTPFLGEDWILPWVGISLGGVVSSW